MDPEFLDMMLVKVITGIVMGLILGSFTTMLSYRIPRHLSIVKPPSQCPHCHTYLSKRDLIPVISWIKGKGHCRHCQTQIGTRYLIIELITTFAVTLAFVTIGFEPALIAALLAIIGFVTLVTINIEKRG